MWHISEILVNRTMQTSDVTCSAWDLAYNDSTDRKADYINDSIEIEYENYYKVFFEKQADRTYLIDDFAN